MNELSLKKSFKPDVVFIDYLNICASARFKGGNISSYFYIKAIAEELRGLAVEFNVPIFSATQTTRTGYVSTDIGLEDTSESFGLPATADFMFALMSNDELEQLGQMKVKQLKNRYNDPAINRSFIIGVDRAKMKLYDVENVALNNTGCLILTVGKCENRKRRLAEYRVGNAGIVFHFFKEVPINQLRKEEKKLIKLLQKKGYKLFKTSQEQFIVEDRTKTEKLLSEYQDKIINKPFKKIDYNVATLDGENLDIRNLRPPSAFMPGETAMCLRKAGLGEEYRKVMTRFIPNGKGITELSKPAPKLIDEKSWDVWQAAVKNTEYKYKQKKGPFKYDKKFRTLHIKIS